MSGESNDPSAYPALAEAVHAVHAVQEAQPQHPHPQQPELPLQDDSQPPPPLESPSQHQQHQHEQEQEQEHEQHQVSVALQYDGLQATATAVAHHGLQALEAATAAVAATPSPLAQQYAQSASMHIADTQYAPMTPQQPVQNGTSVTPTSLQAAAQKVTRLRRACDMCSSRKVKVSCLGAMCGTRISNQHDRARKHADRTRV